MKHLIRVPQGLLHLGARLGYDIFDAAGKLLLRSGAELASEAQLARLQELGYFDPEAVDSLRKRAAAQSAQAAVTGYVPDRAGQAFSAFAALASACQRLEAVFADQAPELEPEVLAIAALVRQSCLLDDNGSLATVLVALPFPHIVRHAVNSAVITATALQRQKHDVDRLLAAVAAALTMNIGALDLHEELFHLDTALDATQRARVRAHPEASVAHLRARRVGHALWLAIVAQHHEAIDGSGYPLGLAGEQILPEAQMVLLADRYCAMVSERVHRDPMFPPHAIKEIRSRHGNAVSQPLMALLIASMGLYPPGTFVKLANGEFAVVVHRLLDLRHPVVYAIAAGNGAPYDPPRKRLTAEQPHYEILHPILRKSALVPVQVEHLWPPVIAAAPLATPA